LRWCRLTFWNESGIIDPLAAAYANNGDFDQAVRRENMP
jgi:hypothetical protein